MTQAATSAPTGPGQTRVGMGESASYLADLYAGLGSHKNDFRNYNLNRLIASLVEGDSVLDIGSGGGALITILHRMGKDASGIEPNRDLINTSLARDPDLHLYHATGDKVDQLGRTFDSITIIDVLEHIEDDRAQLGRIWRTLKPGGQLIVLVPAFQCLYGKRDEAAGHYLRYSRAQLTERCRDAGFEIESTRYWNAIGFAPYWFAERVLRRELRGDIRTERAKGPLKRALVSALHFWYRKVENNRSLGFGLSLIVTARKPADAGEGEGSSADTPEIPEVPEVHVREVEPARPAAAV